MPEVEPEAYDYISPGLIAIDPPQSEWVVRNTMRRFGDPHAWYHRQDMLVNAFVNRDEATLLYNTALKFPDGKGLEIGSASGWSAWHILASGMKLAMIDPGFCDNLAFESCRKLLLKHQGCAEACLVPSPAGAMEMGRRHGPFPFVYIDGNHDAPNPIIDAAAAMHFCTEDAIIMMHDAWNPGVRDALKMLRAFGWETGIYHTSGLMAAAWRGNVSPVKHVADPAIIARPLEGEHLQGLDKELWLS